VRAVNNDRTGRQCVHHVIIAPKVSSNISKAMEGTLAKSPTFSHHIYSDSALYSTNKRAFHSNYENYFYSVSMPFKCLQSLFCNHPYTAEFLCFELPTPDELTDLGITRVVDCAAALVVKSFIMT
jgi:hypothetical protein